MRGERRARRGAPAAADGPDREGLRLRGPDGKASLLDLFEGRRQLILYHFMYAPGVEGWPEAGCPGCSMVADQVGHLAHFHARDTSFVLVSRAPLERLLAYRERMGWDLPWYSSAESDFNDDFGAHDRRGRDVRPERLPARRRRRLPHLLHRPARRRGARQRLDLPRPDAVRTAGDWEDSPDGWPQTQPYTWWRRHDEYEQA